MTSGSDNGERNLKGSSKRLRGSGTVKSGLPALTGGRSQKLNRTCPISMRRFPGNFIRNSVLNMLP